jgi:hypothetical protein
LPKVVGYAIASESYTSGGVASGMNSLSGHVKGYA